MELEKIHKRWNQVFISSFAIAGVIWLILFIQLPRKVDLTTSGVREAYFSWLNLTNLLFLIFIIYYKMEIWFEYKLKPLNPQDFDKKESSIKEEPPQYLKRRKKIVNMNVWGLLIWANILCYSAFTPELEFLHESPFVYIFYTIFFILSGIILLIYWSFFHDPALSNKNEKWYDKRY